ncbi:hypothetical protein DND58_31170 [Pseudomonas syringae pv. pisi]|nr:hypothetical protein DND62_32180 [Pseudomonas syringae pv. pisi]PYD19984.1 hypothetical protein DND58_31170 [Pseudomonas syringae pv. pisi]
MTVCSTAVLHLLSVDPAHAAESNRNYWACAQWGSPCSTILSFFSIAPKMHEQVIALRSGGCSIAESARLAGVSVLVLIEN